MGELVLLVCDKCRHYFGDGRRSAEPLRPNDLAHAVSAIGDVDTLLPAARAAGWQSQAVDGAGTQWSCPECVAKRPS